MSPSHRPTSHPRNTRPPAYRATTRRPRCAKWRRVSALTTPSAAVVLTNIVRPSRFRIKLRGRPNAIPCERSQQELYLGWSAAEHRPKRGDPGACTRPGAHPPPAPPIQTRHNAPPRPSPDAFTPTRKTDPQTTAPTRPSPPPSDSTTPPASTRQAHGPLPRDPARRSPPAA